MSEQPRRFLRDLDDADVEVYACTTCGAPLAVPSKRAGGWSSLAITKCGGANGQHVVTASGSMQGAPFTVTFEPHPREN